jgi:RNA polymerase sigma-70 factor (ECF subfamily)
VDEPSEQNDKTLLPLLAAGTPEGFSQLYDRYGARLYSTALRLLGRSQDAEDAVQETFAALVRSRHRIAGIEDLKAYLFASLRRSAARLATRRGAEPPLSERAVEQAATPEPAPDDPRGERLARGLARLPIEQREVIAMKIEGELTFAEIGRALGISANTAASRYRYGLERLREWMKE